MTIRGHDTHHKDHKPKHQRPRLGLATDQDAELSREYTAWGRFWRGIGKSRRKPRRRKSGK